jgi:hypothetical protein
MYLAREMTPKSYPNIGRCFGNRDHTTVMHAIAAVEARMGADRFTAIDVEALRARIISPVDKSPIGEGYFSEDATEHSENTQERIAA